MSKLSKKDVFNLYIDKDYTEKAIKLSRLVEAREALKKAVYSYKGDLYISKDDTIGAIMIHIDDFLLGDEK